MLGRFLEFSVTTADIQASLSFYGKLGFSQAEVGEAWNHPYAVVTDGRIVLGLHQDPHFAASLTFVKPGLSKHLPQLEQLGLDFEFRRLGDEVFNELGWFDPSGHLVRLVEARTFSPPKRGANERSACGYFVGIALPATAPDAAKDHWERLGFVGMDENHTALPHVACTSDSIEIGLYDPAQIGEPTLLFEVDDWQTALTTWGDLGVTPNPRMHAALRRLPGTLINAPEGTAILIAAATDTVNAPRPTA